MNSNMNDIDTVLLQLSENGQFVLVENVALNRAYLFGDGVFETMIYADGKIRFKETHLARMENGCEILKIDLKVTLDSFEAYLQNNYGQEAFRIRWNVYREGLGRYSPESNFGNELYMLQKYHYQNPLIKKAYINKNIQVPKLPWSNCKTMNALVYVMANLERQKKKYEEVILLNSEGMICEAGAANVFWIKNDVYYTPSLGSNCVAGIARKIIIDELLKQDIELIKGEFTPKEFLAADEVFTSNVTGINYISHIDLREFEPKPIPFLETLFEV